MWFDERGSEVLPHSECLRLVALAAKEGGVGRLGVSRPGAPVIHPVNFSYRDRTVFVVLGDGFMAAAASGALVAFEVDRVDDASVAWSVLVRGLATPWPGEDGSDPGDIGLRPLVPEPGQRFLAIRADVVTGRRFPLRGGLSITETGDPSSAVRQ
jgi:hypothetical protein